MSKENSVESISPLKVLSLSRVVSLVKKVIASLHGREKLAGTE
jgi:hypothetical protein